ncbi:MAG TPA: transposase, partial [Desulfobulbaceae bacterium]|nr:transposase [Desulfobulbaceae bacterium]
MLCKHIRQTTPKGLHMIRYKSTRQLSLEGFSLPFGGKLNPENRWVKWSLAIPWDELASGYYKSMSSTQGRPGKDARLVIGAVIIKHKLNLSDEETVLQIQENPYLQYFVGLSSYKDEPPFTASLFVEIRKRMGRKVFS